MQSGKGNTFSTPLDARCDFGPAALGRDSPCSSRKLE